LKKVILFLLLVAICLACNINSKVGSGIIYPKKTYKGVEALFVKYACRVSQDRKIVELKPSFVSDWDKLQGVIKKGTKKEVNFCGKFIIIQWGCGTECQTGVIINALTGKIVTLPTSEWGVEYRKNSRLLIINPPSKTGIVSMRPMYSYPAYYFWNQNKFVLLYDTRK